MSTSEPARDYWDFFIAECVRQRAPLYVRLASGVREDAKLSALAARARPGQPMANLILGAVHLLLLRGLDHGLRAHYRTLNPQDAALATGDPFPLFRDVCLAHEAEIAAIVARRVTNTNEVGRSAYLRAGFLRIAMEAGEPLHVIELGPSAGLNLHWDRYLYRYVRDRAVFTAGASDGQLILETQLVGPHTPPLQPSPRVGLRLGLERDPVDLSDPEARLWLKALVWPDHKDRFLRLERALEAASGHALDIESGDALTLLPDALAKAPHEGALVVTHTMTTYQFSKMEREALNNLLILASVRRPVWRLSMEWGDGVYPLKLTRYLDGATESRILAICDPQGGMMEWRDDKSP
jgi:hypothetical protein